LGAALRDARRLEKERMPWASALAQLIRAAAAAARHQNEAAAAQYRKAAELLDLVDMRLFAAAARHRAGELLGGDEGRRMRGEANDWMQRQQVRCPERILAMVVPNFRSRGE
jgi:hypothetical protein